MRKRDDTDAWAVAPFGRFADYFIDSKQLLDLYIKSVGAVAPFTGALSALARSGVILEKYTKAEADKIMEDLEIQAQFAEEQIRKGCPSLHAHELVGLWGALEVLVGDISCVWLTNKPEVMKSDLIGRIRIPLADYDRLTSAERMTFLVRELARHLNADLKPGIAKAETILGAVGLGGEVDPGIKRILYEMSQTRNLLVHCGGVVDRRLRRRVLG